MKINKRTKAGQAALAFQVHHKISDDATFDLYEILRGWGKREKKPTPPWMPWNECIEMWDIHHGEHNDGRGADWRPANLQALKRILMEIKKRIDARQKKANGQEIKDLDMNQKIQHAWNWIIQSRNGLTPGDFWLTWDLCLIDRKFSDFYANLTRNGKQQVTKEDFQRSNQAAVERRFGGSVR